MSKQFEVGKLQTHCKQKQSQSDSRRQINVKIKMLSEEEDVSESGGDFTDNSEDDYIPSEASADDSEEESGSSPNKRKIG